MQKNLVKLLSSFLMFISVQIHAQKNYAVLDSIILADMKQASAPGAALAVVVNNKIVYQKSFGVGNVFTNKSIDAGNSIFHVASITKTFTALALLKVCEQKQIDIHKPLGTYFKDLTTKQSQLTIHQILSHTSGMVDVWENDKNKNLEKYFTDMGNDGFFDKPDAVFSYSNNGYAFAGLILEKLTNKPYQQAIHDLIIQPLQLSNTLFGFTEVQQKDYVSGHQNNFSVDPVLQAPKDLPAGGLFSTTNDLLKFASVFYTQNISEKQSLQTIASKMFGKYVYDGTMPEYLGYADAYYGYGFINFSFKGIRFSGHPGEGVSQNTTFAIAPEHNGCIVILSNAGFSPFRKSFEKAVEMFFPVQPTNIIAQEPKEITHFEPKDLVGKYVEPKTKSAISDIMEIKTKDDLLYLSYNGDEPILLEKSGINKYIIKADIAKFPIEIGFYENKESKKIKYLVFYGRVLVRE